MDWRNITPPFWMNSGNAKRYAAFLNDWYNVIKKSLEWPQQQFDADTAALFIVDLLAWERGIDRFVGEYEWLYRMRVKYAAQNAKDAGSTQGFRAIWERLGLGYIEIDERVSNRDWDVIILNVTDHVIANYPKLIDVILSNYALTCRRYELTTVAANTLNVRCDSYGQDTQNLTAGL